MKLECLKNGLRDNLSLAERLTGKNLSLPVLSSVFLETGKNNLLVRATNLEVGVEFKIPAKVDKSGQVALRGPVLISLLNNLKEDKVTLELINDNVLVSTDYQTTLVKAVPGSDFPSLPSKPETESLNLPTSILTTGLRSVFFASATSSIKPEINSVYVYSDDNHLIFVATDSFRLAEKKMTIPEFDASLEMIIPARNVGEIIRILESTKEQIELNYNKNQLTITGDNFYFISRLIDGVFPDYRQIMPSSAKTEVIVSREEFGETLKLANIFANKLNQIDCKIVPESKVLEIISQNADVGESQVKIGAEITGEAVEMSFNVRYLLEMFQSLTDDQIIIKFNGKNKPVLFHGATDQSFSYLVMPMNR